MTPNRLIARLASTVLDPTIVWSYGRAGFWLHRQLFDPDDLRVDLTGRRYLITGASSGLGLATAHGLAARGAEVWMLCRSLARGRAAQQRIPHPTHLGHIDLSDFDSIRSFCEDFLPERIDGLINNAGVLADEHAITAEGFERSLATNLIGPHLLTRMLLPRLQQSDDGRLVFVSSGGMYTQRLRVDQLQMPAKGFDGVVAYARSKRAQVVVAEQLADELAQTNITVSCMHPGWADTPGVQRSLPTFRRLTRPILRNAQQGADTIVWLAAAQPPRGQSGRFWFDRETCTTHALPNTAESPQERERLRMTLENWITR